MTADTLRLTGVVSERPPEVDPLHQELRELITENDRLIIRNQRLKRERDQALDRIARLLKSARPVAWTAPPEPIQTAVELGRLRINHNLRLISLDGRETHVSRRILEVLAYLAARPDCVVTTTTLADALGHTDEDAVRTVIQRTRIRLAEIGAERYLRTYGRSKAGGGYWMEAPGDRS